MGKASKRVVVFRDNICAKVKRSKMTNDEGFSNQLNPPTPAFAKAGAAPGTTAGVERVFLRNRHPKATSMAAYGRPSLPFARP